MLGHVALKMCRSSLLRDLSNARNLRIGSEDSCGSRQHDEHDNHAEHPESAIDDRGMSRCELIHHPTGRSGDEHTDDNREKEFNQAHDANLRCLHSQELFRRSEYLLSHLTRQTHRRKMLSAG